MVAKFLPSWEIAFCGILRAQRVLCSETPINPQTPISIVYKFAVQAEFVVISAINGKYLLSLRIWAASMPSSAVQVNSITIALLSWFDQTTTSGRRLVGIISGGKIELNSSRSTMIFQLLALCNKPFCSFFYLWCPACPAGTKDKEIWGSFFFYSYLV